MSAWSTSIEKIPLNNYYCSLCPKSLSNNSFSNSFVIFPLLFNITNIHCRPTALHVYWSMRYLTPYTGSSPFLHKTNQNVHVSYRTEKSRVRKLHDNSTEFNYKHLQHPHGFDNRVAGSDSEIASFDFQNLEFQNPEVMESIEHVIGREWRTGTLEQQHKDHQNPV